MTRREAPEQRAITDGDPVALVRQALDRLRYGSIVLTLHDGKVVQMDVTERHRLA